MRPPDFGRASTLLDSGPRRHRPGVHHSTLAHAHQPFGEVDGGADVRGNNLDEIADPEPPRLLGQLHPAVFFPQTIDLAVRLSAEDAVALPPAAEGAALRR